MAALDLAPGPDYVLRGHRDSVNALCFLSDDMLSSGSGDVVSKIWDLASRRAVSDVKVSDTSSILSLSCIAQRNMLLSCARDGAIKVWDAQQCKLPLTTFFCGVGHFCNAATDRSQRDANTVVTPSSDESQIIIWDIRIGAGSNDNALAGDCRGGVRSKAISCIETEKSEGMLSSLHYNSCALQNNVPNVSSKNIQIYEEEECHNLDTSCDKSNELQDSVEPSLTLESSLYFQYSQNMLLAGFESGCITSYDIRTGRVLCKHSCHQEPVMTMDSISFPSYSSPSNNFSKTTETSVADRKLISSYGTKVATGGAGSEIVLHGNFNISEENNKTPMFAPLGKPGTGCVRFRPDGRIFVTGHWDHSVRVFSSKKMKPLAIMRHHTASVYAVDFAMASSQIFATGSKDCTIALWSLYSTSK